MRTAPAAESGTGAQQKAVYRDYTVKTFQPIGQYRFTGTIFVLIDALTVSAGVNAARLLQNAGAAVIGTETRGGYYSCNALQYVHIHLPPTGLLLRIPIYRQVFTSTPVASVPPQCGLIPDYIVPHTFEDKISGTDSQVDFCMQLITQ